MNRVTVPPAVRPKTRTKREMRMCVTGKGYRRFQRSQQSKARR